jgi:hypothetical protein
MVTSSESEAVAKAEADPARYFDRVRREVDPFVARHFGWSGTLRLHRDALGLDILRAPLNVILAPVFVLTRLMAYLVRRAGCSRGAAWLSRRRIILRTSVARRVEALLLDDLLLRTAENLDQFAPSGIRTASRQTADGEEARIILALSDYAGTRSAVAEMTTVVCTLAIGAIVFQTLTPGMFSMAPGVADAMARAAAIADFPLGRTLGGAWYGVFAPDAAPWLIITTLVALIMVGSVIAAFAGVLADPVQRRLGIHRRRLMRLIDTIEADTTGAPEKPFTTREHFYARFVDLFDAVASLLRALRS